MIAAQSDTQHGAGGSRFIGYLPEGYLAGRSITLDYKQGNKTRWARALGPTALCPYELMNSQGQKHKKVRGRYPGATFH